MMRLTLGEAIGVARRRAGLEQVEIADALGVTQKTVSRWERDLSGPPYAAVIRFVRLVAADENDALALHQMLASCVLEH